MNQTGSSVVTMSNCRTLAVLLIVVVLLAAAASTVRLGEDAALGRRSVLITIEHPNAAQDAIERDIVIPLEDQLAGIRGVGEVEAYVRPGRAQVQVRFTPNTRMDGAYLEVRESVERAAAGFPTTARRPIINRADIDARPLFAVAFDAANWSEADIRTLFEHIEGVARVEVSGATSGDIEIVYDFLALPHTVSTVGELVRAVRNRQVAAGTSAIGSSDSAGTGTGTGTLPLVLDTRAADPDDLKRTWVNDTLRVEQVAVVRAAAVASAGLARVDGHARALAYIYNSADSGAVTVSRRLREATTPHQDSVILLDRGAELERRLLDAALSMAAGLLSICLLTYLIDRSLRLTLVAAGGLAVATLAGAAATAVFRYDMTVLILAALAISAGLAIDGVVVLFDALRHTEGEIDRARKRAAAPVTLSALTTVVVFIPLFFAPATAVERYGGVAVTITASLTAAVVYVLLLAPSLSKVAENKPRIGRVKTVPAGAASCRTYAALQRIVLFSLMRRRLVLVSGVAIALAATLVWFISPLSGVSLPGSGNSIEFNLVFEPGTTASAVAEQSRELEDAAIDADGVERVIADYRNERARFVVRLRSRSRTTEVRDAVKLAARSIEAGELFFADDLNRNSSGLVTVSVRGPRLETAQSIATSLAEAYQRLAAVDRVVLHFREGAPAHLLALDLIRSEQLAVDPAAIIAELRWAVGRQVVAKRPGHEREHDIVLLPSPDHADTVASLMSLPMFGAERKVSALDVGDLHAIPTTSSISRVNRARSARLSVLTSRPKLVARRLKEGTGTLPIPDGYSVEIASQARQDSAGTGLPYGAVILATLLIGAVLVGYSQRVTESVMVLAQLPVVLSIPVLALLALGVPINDTVLMGLILSAGVSVNNSILVLETRNRLTDDCGRGEIGSAPALLTEAIIAAARPLTVAAATTLIGIAPLLLGIGEQTTVAVLSLALTLGVLGSLVSAFTLLPALYLSFILPVASRMMCRRSRSAPLAASKTS